MAHLLAADVPRGRVLDESCEEEAREGGAIAEVCPEPDHLGLAELGLRQSNLDLGRDDVRERAEAVGERARARRVPTPSRPLAPSPLASRLSAAGAPHRTAPAASNSSSLPKSSRLRPMASCEQPSVLAYPTRATVKRRRPRGCGEAERAWSTHDSARERRTRLRCGTGT